MYRVNLEGGVSIECETLRDVEQLLTRLGAWPPGRPASPNQPEAPSPGGSPDLDLDARDRVTRFLAGMTETSVKVVKALLEDPEKGKSLKELKTALDKKDPKAVGGAIAGVNRKAKAKGSDLPHVVIFDQDLGRYRLNDRFLSLYRGAGSPAFLQGARR